MLLVGFLSVALYWIFVVYILKRWEFDHSLTISDHVASDIQRKMYNPVAMLLVSAFMVYLVTFLLPKYSSGWLAYVAVSIAWLGELIVIQYPRAGRHYNLHDGVASAVGTALMLLVALIGLSIHATTQTKQFTLVYIVLLLAIGFPLLKRNRKHYSFYQSAYFGGLQVVLLVLGFLSN